MTEPRLLSCCPICTLGAKATSRVSNLMAQMRWMFRTRSLPHFAPPRCSHPISIRASHDGSIHSNLTDAGSRAPRTP
jgi:hypothetical protein